MIIKLGLNIYTKFHFFQPYSIHHHFIYSIFNQSETHQSLNLNHPLLSKLEQTNLTVSQFNQVHTQIITTGLFHSTFAASRLLKFPVVGSESPNLSLIVLIFSTIKHPDVFCFNLVIKAHARSCTPLSSFYFYKSLLIRCLKPNEYTLCFLLDCCSDGLGLLHGKQIHGQIYKHGFCSATFSSTSLVHMYSKGGDFEDAMQVFDQMAKRSDVTWGAIINACVEHEKYSQAFSLFREIRRSCIEPSNATLVSIISAFIELRDLSAGRVMHAYIVILGLEINITLGTNLVDFYAKCGDLCNAMQVFSSMEYLSVATMNCLIHGLAMNGYGKTAIRLFKKIRERLFLQPNEVTFLSLLHACSHAGLVEDGLEFFSQMSRCYGIQPSLKHYGCLVDLYGRAGLLNEAVDIVREMKMQPDFITWGALFGACKIHGYDRLAELTAAQIVKMVPQDACGYLLLSDSYAWSKRWNDVACVRKMMSEMSIRKSPGCSSISSLCQHTLLSHVSFCSTRHKIQ